MLSTQLRATSSPESITEQTTRVLENLKAVLTEAGIDLTRVIKTTVFLKDMKDFAAMNEIYALLRSRGRRCTSALDRAGRWPA